MVLNPYIKLLVILLLCLALAVFYWTNLVFADDFDATPADDHADDKDHSLVGSLFNFVGNVVAFPFRMVGNVFDAVF